MGHVIGDLGNYKSLSESLIDLAENGKVFEAMEYLKKTDPDTYLKQGNKLERRLIDIYKDAFMKSQSQYDLSSFYISSDTYQKLSESIEKWKSAENLLAIVGSAGIGKTHFLVCFFEQVLNCQVIIIKNSDGLRHVSFFKGKRYVIIYDDLAWVSETMTRERMLQVLSGEVTTNSNIKHSSVLVPKDTCRALTSNYSLHDTKEF